MGDLGADLLLLKELILHSIHSLFKWCLCLRFLGVDGDAAVDDRIIQLGKDL